MSRYRDLHAQDVQNYLKRISQPPTQQQPSANQAGALANQVAEDVRRERGQSQQAQEAQQVRALAAEGAETQTDVVTGRRTVARHEDGGVKFTPGPLGEVKSMATTAQIVPDGKGNIERNADGTPRTMPEDRFMMGSGGGAAGTSGASTTTQFGQAQRDDRGNVRDVPVEPTTDKKTGNQYIERTDPATGEKGKQLVGIDPEAQKRAARAMRIEDEEYALARKGNNLGRHKLQFMPKWDPVNKEYEEAVKELEKLPNNFERRGEATVRVDEATGKETFISPEEVRRRKDIREQAQNRVNAAEQARNALLPQSEQIAKAEEDIKIRGFDLAEQKIRLEHGLPEDDGETAKVLAWVGYLEDKEIDAESPFATPERYQAVLEHVRAGGEMSTTGVMMGGTLGEEEQEQPEDTRRPLIPDEVEGNPLAAEQFAEAFKGMQNPEALVLSPRFEGNERTQWMERDGKLVGRIQIDPGGTGVPMTILSTDRSANLDLQTLVAFGEVGGAPIYLPTLNTPNYKQESEWVASVFDGIKEISGMADLDDAGRNAAFQAQMKEAGSTPYDIAQKVRAGEISVQHGELLMKEIYGSTLRPDQPTKEAMGEWARKDPERMKQWVQATKQKGKVAERNELAADYLNDWFNENRFAPGVTVALRNAMEKSLIADQGFWEGKGTMAAQMAGSTFGMFSVALLIPMMEASYGYDLVTGSDKQYATGKFNDEYYETLGRAWTNANRGLYRFISRNHGQGQAEDSVFNATKRELQQTILLQDSYPDAYNSPEWKEKYKDAVNAVTDAAWGIHQINLEEGWEMTRDDLDPFKNRGLGKMIDAFAVSGDKRIIEQYFQALEQDHGSRQLIAMRAEYENPESNAFMLGVAGGQTAPPQEILVEMVTSIPFFWAGKALSAQVKVAKLSAQASISAGTKVSSSAAQVLRVQAAVQGMGREFAEFGMKRGSVAAPLTAIDKTRNVAVQGVKLAAAGAITEAPQEAVMGASEFGATWSNVTHDAAWGAVMGFFMGPMFASVGAVTSASRANYNLDLAAKEYTDFYNGLNKNKQNYKPITVQEAKTAMALVPREIREHYQTVLDVKRENLKAASAAASKEGATTLDFMRFSRAQAELHQVRADLAGETAWRTEAVAAIRSLPADQQAIGNAVMKVASGRADLLTAEERKAAGGATTRDGKPMFSTVEGLDVVTDAGKAQWVQDSPIIGTQIRRTESEILLEAQEAKNAERATQGLAPIAPIAPAAEQSPESGTPTDSLPEGPTEAPAVLPDAAGVTPQAPETAAQDPSTTPPAAQGPAMMEAGMYEAARASNPAMPEIPAAVSAAFAAGQPVSVSMQSRSGVEVPDGYTRQGNVWTPPQAPAAPAAPSQSPAAAPEAPGGGDVAARVADPALPPIPPDIAKSQPVGKTLIDERGDTWVKTDTGWTLTSKAFAGSDGVESSQEMTDEIAQRAIGRALMAPAPAAPAAAGQAPAPIETAPIRPSTTSLQKTQAKNIAGKLKAELEASRPNLKGRITITNDSNQAPSGGVAANMDGAIEVNLPDVAVRIKDGGIKVAEKELRMAMLSHEARHLAQFEFVDQNRQDGETFAQAWTRIYGKDGIHGELTKIPGLIDRLKEIYDGKKSTESGTSAWEQIPTDENKAAEGVRILLEIYSDPAMAKERAAVSELFRAQGLQDSKLVELIETVIAKIKELIASLTDADAAILEEHLAGVEALYADLIAEQAAPQAQEASSDGLTTKRDGDNSTITSNGEVIWKGKESDMESSLAEIRAEKTSPMRLTGDAIKAAEGRFPKLKGKFRAVEDAISDAVEAAAPADRAQAAEKAVADEVNRLADIEAEKTGKKREEIIEGFRAVAGKQSAKQAASIEQAVVGTEAPVIPAGKQEKRDTPNSEMTVDVTSTFVDLDQLVGSSDPMFPGSALQPRNRSTQASQNQREEMVQNIRDKDDQHRRYLEGSTTDAGRMVVAPLFGADGKQMTNDAGKPMFYVISGNGRRNALSEAAKRGVSGKVMQGFRATAATEKIDVDGMTLPVPVSIFQPKSAKEAIDLAEYSNRDAQLAVSNTEQANRDAASIEKANILPLWDPDANGDAAAASNRDFVKAFARAVADEGIIDGRGNLTDEGAKRIERAMVAMLLGPEQATLMDMLFNRSGDLGLRAILGGVASESGNLLKLAATKPDFDIAPVLADALRTAVEAKQALANGEIRDVGEFFEQGNLFEDTAMTPERQLARAIVESRSRKAIRDILGSYRRGAEAVDTSTASMFAEAETTRADLIEKALDARPIDQVITEVAAELGQNADLPAKLRVVAAGIKKLPLDQRKAMNAAIGAEVERLRDGVVSATEYQRINPDALTPMEAMFQRILDSHTPASLPSAMGKMLARPTQNALASSPAPVLPDNVEFVRFPKNSGTLGVPRREMPQVKGKDRPEFMEFLKERGVKFTNEDMKPADIKPVQAEYAPAKVERAKGIPFERRIFVSADNYLLDGHHQWLAQMGRDAVKVTRLSLNARPALKAIFSFPKTQTAGGLSLASSPAPVSLHRKEGSFRSDWKITKAGRSLLDDKTGKRFTVDTIDIAGRKLTLKSEDGRTVPMPIKEAEKRFMVELDAEELAMEPLFEARHAQFAAMKAEFDAKVSTIAANLLDASPLIPGLKGMPRALEKAAGKLITKRSRHEAANIPFNEAEARQQIIDGMADILRASIIVDNKTQVMGANAAILRAFVPEARFSHKSNDGDIFKNKHISLIIDDRFRNPTPAGYSDVQMKIELAPGMFVELQVHIPEMLIAKEGWFPGIPEKYKAEILGVPNGLGHKYFEEYRTYPADSTAPRKLKLEELMKDLYGQAIAAAESRLAAKNSSQDSGPRVSAASGQGRVAPGTSTLLPDGPITNTPPASTATGSPSLIQNSARGEKGLGKEAGALITSEDTNRRGGTQDNSASVLASSPAPEYVTLTRGDKGNDPITPTTAQQLWEKRNPQSATKLRAIIDRQAKASGYNPAKYLHGTPGKNSAMAQNAESNSNSRLGIYEGTAEGDFTEFLREKTRGGMGLHFFTQDPAWAENFTGLEETNGRAVDGYRIIPAYLKIKNPWNVDNAEHRALIPELINERHEHLTGGFGWITIEKPEVIERIKSLGFDAIMMRERDPEGWNDDYETVAIFESSQAKDSSLVTFQNGKIIDPADRFNDRKSSILYSSPAPQLDLFGGIEASLTGPRAKAKSNALDQMRKAPPKAREAIAKEIGKREGLADLDLFAAAAQSNLDAKPKRGESVVDDNATGQSGNPFNPRLHGGQPAASTRGPRTVGANQDLFDFSGRSSGATGNQTGGSTASDVQGPQAGLSGSRDGSTATNPDGRGGRPGNEGSGGRNESGQPDTGNAGKRSLSERQRPTEGSPDRNFSIGPNTILAEGGAVTRLRNNLSAIDLLRTLEKDGRNATPAEKAVLAKYVGWGGIPQVFDAEKARAIANGEIETRRETARQYKNYGPAHAKEVAMQETRANDLENWRDKWGDHYNQLKELLTPVEWESARDSTINAHYTSPTVINGMWDAVARFGFEGGNVLEPAGGIGHYFGLMPESMIGKSRLFGIELDSVSGRVFSKLYPEAEIEVTGFEDSTLPNNSQDLIISNVPFANFPVTDSYLDTQPGAPTFNLHNYFFERALRTTRPGGVVAFITTAHTMDSQIMQRKWLAERADFLGAIRLPNDAFKANANTQVTTDIIFLRKPDGSANPMAAEQWTSTQAVKLDNGSSIEINEYFARHPEMILGRLADDGSMRAGKKEMTVHSTGDLAEQLRGAVANLPANIMGDGKAAEVERVSQANKEAKDGAFIEENGSITIKGDATPIPAKELGRVRSFIKLRDALNTLYEMEGNPLATDTLIDAQRAALNRAYDGFRNIHKPLHDSKNKAVLQSDPDFYRTLGLEVPHGEAKAKQKQAYQKADVFSKRVLEPRVEPTTAKSIDDAIIQSFRWRGRMDAGFIGKLLGVPLEKAEAQLLSTPAAYRDPVTGMIEHSTTYLAGNVRKKLRDAEFAAKRDGAMQRNVDALKAAMPMDVGWADVNFKMGSAWIPAEIYEQFLKEKVFGGRKLADIIYNKGVGDLITDSFIVQAADAGYAASIDTQWGTPRKSATQIAEALLNQRDPRVTSKNADGKPAYDAPATEMARAAANRMAEAFQEWVASDAAVQEKLHGIYNESFNSHVIPAYDGSFMQLPWVAKDFDLYPDKKHVVWRAMQEGSLLVAHGVGGGKTIIGTAIAMEARRLGLAQKPLIVVHNATLEQFATTMSQMAPTARVLVARKSDLAGPKRKEFMGRVRAGEWDAVVMAHSTFDLIPDDPAWERKQITDLIGELEDAIRDQGGDPSVNDLKKIKDPSVKELVKMRTRLKDRMGKLQERTTDDVLNFQELGIDAMIIDEVHRYKKQPFVTRQSNIAGIDTGFSKRGSAMQLRSKWIQATNQGRGVFTMTGTPVTNTLGESWNMVRLVRPDLLKEFNVQTFDRFVSVFGNIKQSGELRPNGQYKPVTRLSEFTNIPEWNRFWGLAADVKMGEDMNVKGRPRIKGGKPGLTAVERTNQVKAVIDEISKVIDQYDAMTGKEKNENRHIPLLTYAAARMAAIDIRLINPEAADEAGSKVNTALGNVMRLYTQTTEQKGTQVIFSDSYRPLKTTKLDLSAAEFEQALGDPDAQDGDVVEANDGGFNLYHDIREKLVKAGVPRSEIAIIGEMKNDKQKDALFARVNSGEVRIIMGSTETLGTGVNMQERMIAAHHLDVPWTPAGLEQRDGRVYRQGNMWAEIGTGEIEIMRYGMKDTLDAALWQKLETKERMIKQAVSGKVNARVIEDDAGLLNYMEQKAALSGADGMLKFELDEKVRNLKNDHRAHRNRQFDMQRATGVANGTIESVDAKLPNARRSAKLVEPLVAVDPTEVSWTFQDGDTVKGEPARKALDAMFKERRKQAGQIKNAETAESIREPIHATANGVPVVIEVAGVSEDLANAANPDLRWNIAWHAHFGTGETWAFYSSPHPGSVINQMPSRAQDIAIRPQSLESSKAQAAEDLTTFAKEMAKPFAQQDAFGQALVDQAVLYKRMGMGLPESKESYQSGLGDRWESIIDEALAEQPEAGETTARAETPGNYPGRGLAPAMSLASSPAPARSDLFAAANAPDARQKLGDVKAGSMNALGAYRTLTAKREKTGKLTAAEEQQLLDAETALGQKLAFDMDAVRGQEPATKAPAPTGPAAAFGQNRRDTQDEMSRAGEIDRSGQMSLLSSPAPATPADSAVQAALASLTPMHRNVFEAISSGSTPAEVSARFKLTDRAVSNLIDQVRSRIATATSAAAGTLDAKRNADGQIEGGGRPDLALGAQAAVAGVDQVRNESGLPDERKWKEVFGQAEALLRDDYAGTFEAIYQKATAGEPMTDVEVATAKRIIARETLGGHIQSHEQRVKIGLLIHGYRDVGTETARALAIRRDPAMTPAERHAQFIAEALFSPDQATRARLSKAKPGQHADILAGWMHRVDTIKAELAAQGIDLDASLARFNAEKTARQQQQSENPATQEVIDEAVRRLTKREKAVITAIRDGALVSRAAFVSGLATQEVKEIYTRFLTDVRTAMAERAKQFVTRSLASSPVDAMSGILADMGFPALDAIDDTATGFVDRRGEKPRAPRKPRAKKATPPAEPTTPQPEALPELTPAQQAALDAAWERFKRRDPSTWKDFWQEEMKTLRPIIGGVAFGQFRTQAEQTWTAHETELFEFAKPEVQPINETTGSFDPDATNREGVLFPQPINETTGTFDLNDPVKVKQIMDAFAIARGTKMDALMEFWRMSILTGPQTHIVNVGSTAMFEAYQLLPRRAVEAGVNSTLGMLGLGSQESATFGEFKLMSQQIRKATTLAARGFLRSWAAESRVFEAYAKGEAAQLDFTGLGSERFAPALGGKFGKVMRSMSFRMMTACDEFLKAFYTQIEAGAQAHRIARVEEKRTGASYEKRIAELMEPGSIAWVRAFDASLVSQFQAPLDGNNPQAMARLDQLAELAKDARNLPYLGRLFTFFLPFINTPANIFKEGLKLTPIGAFLAVLDGARALKRRVLRGDLTKQEAKEEAAKLYDRARLVQDMTNQIIGVALYFALSGLVKPDEDDEDGRPRLTGSSEWKSTKRGERDNQFAVMAPQSIRIGNTVFTYRRWEPFATALASIADMSREIDREGGFTPAVLSKWLSGFKDQAKDKTFLQGISSLIQAIEDPDRFMERTTSNIVTGFVPNIIRQPIRSVDGNIRDTSPRADQGFFESIARRVGYSIVPQLAPVKQDVWGNDVPANTGELIGGPGIGHAIRILDPSRTTVGAQPDPIDLWIFNWNLQTADSKDRISIEPISSKLTGRLPGEKHSRTFALTADEQAEANRTAGRAARSMLGDQWSNIPLSEENAQQIIRTVRQAQTQVRAGLRNQKLIEAASAGQ